MDYFVTMTTHVPDGTSEEAVADLRSREAARSRELAAQGYLLRLWRPPLAPGEWRTLGLFAAAGDAELEEVLASMPLRVWRIDEVTSLSPHPNDPAVRLHEAGPEFLTTFTIAIPDGAPAEAVADATRRAAQRAHELAARGHLIRLWVLPAVPGASRALGLWRAEDAAQMRQIVESLPLNTWMTVETTPLTSHPNDPGTSAGRTTAHAGKLSEGGQRVAIITGASQGIGAGLVAAYRRQGWAIVANSRTIKPSEDRDVLTVDGDIAEPAVTARIISEALERFGRIDTLINNAGAYLSKPFTDYTADDYALMVGVNLTGFFQLTQRAIAEMLARGGGHVVNITTTMDEYAVSAVPSALAALTKGGLASATKSLAIEYASRGIRVNAVSLGVIQTPMHAADSYDELAAMHPIGRLGQVSDVVDGILLLESAPFITGEILHVDGGQSAGH